MVSPGRKAERAANKKAARKKRKPPDVIKVYFEGGGDARNGKDLQIEAQEAFHTLIKRGTNLDVRVVACGGRRTAYERFETACESLPERPVLLVDAETDVSDITRPWAHLKARDQWTRPRNATDDHAFLMVQTMEAWLLADPPALAEALGEHFKPEKIPKWPDLERIHKDDLYHALANASSACEHTFEKGRHSFAALRSINTAQLEKKCPSAARFFATLPILRSPQ